jgi:DHA2 family multidrug resistance protein
MVFIPLATVAMGTLAQKEMGNASGVFNPVRNVGGSVGISLLTTYLVRRSQANQTTLVSNLTPWDPVYKQRLRETQNYLVTHLGPAKTLHQVQGLIYDSLLKKSQLLAFVQSFRILAGVCLICIALALLLRKVPLRRRI